jgi:hypothetical protein
VNGRRWLAVDADLFGKSFTHDLYEYFGCAGVVTWIAYLCACKRSHIPGRIRIMNDVQARHELGLIGWELVDNKGTPWTLDEFWTFTGRKKQTRRTPVGRQFDVIATHWERWQKTAATSYEAERKGRWAAQKRDAPASRNRRARVANATPDSDIDNDIPPTPLEGGADALRAASQNPQDLRAALDNLKASLTPPPPPKKPRP